MNISNTNSDRIIDGSSSADSIYNSGASVSIYAYSGDDTIFNNNDDVYIDAGKGNDSIFINNDYRLTLDAGTGNDTISGSLRAGTFVNSGEDNDLISVQSFQYSHEDTKRNTIQTGAGNDSIYIKNWVYYFNGGFYYGATCSVMKSYCA